MTSTHFPNLIAPMSISEFFASHFERQHMVLAGRDSSYYAELLSMGWLDAYVDAHRPPYTRVFAIDARRKIASEEFAGRDGRVDVARLYQLHAGGATLVYRDLQEQSLPLARLCRSAEKVYGCPFFINAFLSPPQAQCFPIHHDSNDVFALQISGTKHWELYQPVVELPLADQGCNEALAPSSCIEQCVLREGDLFYVPRGFPHLVNSTDLPSLHISLSSYPYTWTDVMIRAVAEVCRRDPAFRASLPASFLQDGPNSDLQATFASLAQKFAELADCSSAVSAIGEEFIRTRPIMLPQHRIQIEAADKVTIDSEIGCRPDLIYVLKEGATELRLLCHDTEIKLPSKAAASLKYALGTTRFRIRDMPGELTLEDKLLLITALMRQGLVHAPGIGGNCYLR
jgi:hypothetical protein